MSISERLRGVLPPWARDTHPVLRYLLAREARRQRPALRWTVRMLGGAAVFWMIIGSYQAYTRDMSFGVSEQGESALFSVLYVPLLILQFFVLTSGMVLAASLLAREQQRGTWEAVKITSHGAELALRARWAAVFYQMRWLLVLLLVPRVIFLGQMLWDLTAFQGRHLDLYISGITPEVPVEAAIVLLAGGMTGALLMPLALLGLNAALGLFLATWFQRRPGITISQTLVLLFETAAFLLALMFGWTVLSYGPDQQLYEYFPMHEKWASVVFMGVAGDQGLRLMNLETVFRTWADIEYGIWIGAVLLGAVVLVFAITQFLLWWAVRRASSPQAR